MFVRTELAVRWMEVYDQHHSVVSADPWIALAYQRFMWSYGDFHPFFTTIAKRYSPELTPSYRPDREQE